MESVKLIPKTGKARNKLHEAGSPDSWIVVERRSEVAFSDAPGPWLLVRPNNNLVEKSRWVNEKGDSLFNVEKL